MALTHIAYEVDDYIATITLNRPNQLNAFTHRMAYELDDLFQGVRVRVWGVRGVHDRR